MDFAKTFRRVWHFLWEEDSALSWIVNIALAFLLVKFIIYPGLGFVLGTGYPVVAVVSGSMEHDGSFDSWWYNAGSWYEDNGIDLSTFNTFPFHNGFDQGDIILLVGVKPEDIEVGDVVVYSSTAPYPIIHRVVKKEKVNNELFFITKGDHNPGPDHEAISEDRILGRAVFRIPVLGWVKIWFTDVVSFVRGG
ncbi:MAG: signal peptidase I [Candidatus Nanoarchaeia archaeon]